MCVNIVDTQRHTQLNWNLNANYSLRFCRELRACAIERSSFGFITFCHSVHSFVFVSFTALIFFLSFSLVFHSRRNDSHSSHSLSISFHLSRCMCACICVACSFFLFLHQPFFALILLRLFFCTSFVSPYLHDCNIEIQCIGAHAQCFFFYHTGELFLWHKWLPLKL